jgi:tetratricopeptide (TPR) repeat protein
MRIPRSSLVVAFLIGLWAAMVSQAWSANASGLVIDPQKQWQFAQQLFQEGRFRQAAQEYERFAFFFPEHPDARTAVLKAGQSFMTAGDGPAALQSFNRLTENGPTDAIAVEAYFMSAETYDQLENPNQAVLLLNSLIALTDRTDVKDRAYLRIGWIHIGQLEWSGARQSWKRISPQGRQAFHVESLETALGQADRLPRKNPTVAGLLSIIPGGGQLYCGRYEDALAALLVDGGLAWGAYDAFDHDLNGLGSLVVLVGIGFYTANIYGAVSDAHKYNRSQKQRFVQQLKQNLAIDIEPLQSAPHEIPTQALVVKWRIPF